MASSASNNVDQNEFLNVIKDDKEFHNAFNKIYIQGVTLINSQFLEPDSEEDFHLLFEKTYTKAVKRLEADIELKSKEVNKLKADIRRKQKINRRKRQNPSAKSPLVNGKLSTRQKEILKKLFGKPYDF